MNPDYKNKLQVGEKSLTDSCEAYSVLGACSLAFPNIPCPCRAVFTLLSTFFISFEDGSSLVLILTVEIFLEMVPD